MYWDRRPLIVWFAMWLHSLADLGGRARRAPLRVPILSFWHTKFLKRNCLGSPHPLLRAPCPPLREILDPPLALYYWNVLLGPTPTSLYYCIVLELCYWNVIAYYHVKCIIENCQMYSWVRYTPCKITTWKLECLAGSGLPRLLGYLNWCTIGLSHLWVRSTPHIVLQRTVEMYHCIWSSLCKALAHWPIFYIVFLTRATLKYLYMGDHPYLTFQQLRETQGTALFVLWPVYLTGFLLLYISMVLKPCWVALGLRPYHRRAPDSTLVPVGHLLLFQRGGYWVTLPIHFEYFIMYFGWVWSGRCKIPAKSVSKLGNLM